ncbi:MAG: hypothetical protein ABIQ70_13035 [Dokdonella sp.]
MSVAAARAAIAARLISVTDIGVVHAYERYASDLARLKQLYFSISHNQVRGWYVRRVQTSETGNILSNTVEHIRWRIVGLMALDDANASELVFDSLIEGVRNAFAADETLGGTVDQCAVPDPSGNSESCIQLDDAGPVMFGGVLCHAARLSLNTIRYLERS